MSESGPVTCPSTIASPLAPALSSARASRVRPAPLSGLTATAGGYHVAGRVRALPEAVSGALLMRSGPGAPATGTTCHPAVCMPASAEDRVSTSHRRQEEA